MQDIINRAKGVLTAPRKFFKGLGKEKGVKAAFRYYAILSAFFIILNAVVGQLFQPVARSVFSSIFNMPVPQPAMNTATLVMSIVLGYVLGLGLRFVWAGILHLWILLWGGRQPYSKTYQLSVYATTPNYVLGWIPVVNLIAGIYGLVLLILGTQETHKISKTKAILMYVIPAVLFVVIWLVAVSLAISRGHLKIGA